VLLASAAKAPLVISREDSSRPARREDLIIILSKLFI
jgi:hypothetical protein